MIVAKQMDIRANIKEYFDLAAGGETLFVPRIGNKNVFIISQEAYEDFLRNSTDGVNLPFVSHSSSQPGKQKKKK